MTILQRSTARLSYAFFRIRRANAAKEMPFFFRPSRKFCPIFARASVDTILLSVYSALATGGYCTFCEQKVPKKLSRMLTHPNSISGQYSPCFFGGDLFCGRVGRLKPYRARQKSVTPNPHEEPCDPNGFKVRQHFRKFFWFSLFTKRTVPYRSQ